MKYIELKKGSALSIVVTVFVMIALLSGAMIVLLKKEIIYINPEYISTTKNNIPIDDKEDSDSIQKPTDIFEKYEGIINGEKLKQLLQDIGNNDIKGVIVYISEEFINEKDATKEKANTIIMTNARITNSTEYTKIIDNSNYKVIYERNSGNVVEKIYVIKISNIVFE